MNTANTTALPDGTHLGRTALRVSALEDLVEFYRDVVGLSVLRRDETTAVLGVDDAPLLVLERDENAPERARSETGLYHNAFRVPSRAALGAALARIRDRWRLDGAADHLVSEALYLSDPAGNGVEIYRDRPREEWPTTDDGRVRMATDPLDFAGIEAAAASDDRAPSGTDVGHVHLEVSSLEAFAEFYADALGFDVRADLSGALFVAADGYHHHVGANTWNRRTEPAEGRGLAWFEVVVPDSRDFEALEERLSDRGKALTETEDGFAVADPDGIELRFRTATP
ncbi:VOC family protein [Halopiger xanaduensis]|uniref:Glyoxalase/bleomycin resistance protein/dioxygenase n=1 Tax=Halopiger xanaduensis (strain DSM 18323 / JCM 14033 / SH-6) TaxID=797210 RepID=F8D374_HALXS|nr:VOC family protein [Halopiger xanaduensis]AEH38506.1 Glyoxalase/bleomycin resistance protein/dioxygenase [Halopiger xanaduensis SH-6]